MCEDVASARLALSRLKKQDVPVGNVCKLQRLMRDFGETADSTSKRVQFHTDLGAARYSIFPV